MGEGSLAHEKKMKKLGRKWCQLIKKDKGLERAHNWKEMLNKIEN